MKHHPKALPIPPRALERTKAKEGMRVWVVEDDAEIALRADILPTPEAWGVMLVDVVHQLAADFDRRGITDYMDAVTRITGAFAKEFERSLHALEAQNLVPDPAQTH